MIDEPDDVDDFDRPLNQCFLENDIYKMVNIVLMNSHVDFSQKDPDEVVRYSMDTTNILLLDPRHDQRVNLFYMKSIVELADSIF